ncbi:HGGxSTG domain-containing protein [Paracoccus sp. KR1-242]|uniref:HGGxSTG domain-containing protein n=1 Tax=Paracoccus sp. KR1-242 TaxID=3410028 RepID=UPI003C0CF72B
MSNDLRLKGQRFARMGMTGKELAVLRRRAGLSQSALAERVGVSRQTISYWEGRPELDGRAVSLTKIASALLPNDRNLVLGSRPGLGFTSLSFTGTVLPKQLGAVFAAMTIRNATEAQMKRQTCGAMTRKGFECMLKSEPGKQRCRLHGGLSTGPTTAEGKARIAEAQRKRWAQHKCRIEKPEKT